MFTFFFSVLILYFFGHRFVAKIRDIVLLISYATWKKVIRSASDDRERRLANKVAHGDGNRRPNIVHLHGDREMIFVETLGFGVGFHGQEFVDELVVLLH